MTATESLFFGTINDFCNKIGTKRTDRPDLVLVCFRGQSGHQPQCQRLL